MSQTPRVRFVVGAAVICGAALAYILVPAPSAGGSAGADRLDSVRESTFKVLDRARRDKHSQLRAYLDRLAAQARQVRRDKILNRSFRLGLEHHRLGLEQEPPPEHRQALAALHERLGAYCLEHYRDFHDMLFVAPEGTIFYGLRQCHHVGQSIFDGELGRTRLARKLRTSRTEAFVDFAEQGLAHQASSFFVEPITCGNGFAGWILLQCSIRSLNELFVRDRGLGRTGEAFLVNRQCLMLTDSRFRRDTDPLALHLSPDNILSKFAEGSGHKTVTDYRGYRALTSFEICEVMGSQWLLVAKIDRAEVVSDRYRRRRRVLAPALKHALQRTPPALTTASEPDGDALVVEMDDHRCARSGEQVITYGVRTCTAIVIHMPGRFAWLGHASPNDALYGGDDQDLLGRMIRRVGAYEIAPFQQRDLRVTIVATHVETVTRAVDRLLKAGYFLAQIRLLHNPYAHSGRVWHDVDAGRTTVRWAPAKPGRGPTYQRSDDATPLGDLARKLMNY
jgi:hypothetical protein